MSKILKHLQCPNHTNYSIEVTVAFDAVIYCPYCMERLEHVGSSL